MSILVPITFGKHDDRALTRAVTYAQGTSQKLHALVSRSLDEFTQEQIDAEIDELSDALDEANIPFKVITRVDNEELGKQLCEVALEAKISTIFVSLATKPINGSYTLGHQVQRLLLESPCDVLVVRDEIHEPRI